MRPKRSTAKGFFTAEVFEQQSEKDRFGVFVSHAGKDKEEAAALTEEMGREGLLPMCDSDFIKTGQEFRPIIHRKMRACSAAVVLITENSLTSGWVSYEIGFLTKLGKKIFLYDPKGILEAQLSLPKENEAARLSFDARRGLLSPHFPEYCDKDKLFAALAPYARYSRMLKADCPGLTRGELGRRIDARVRSVVLSLSSRTLASVSAELHASAIGVMVINFGMFYKGNAEGVLCPHGGAPRAVCDACRENKPKDQKDGDESKESVAYPCALLGQEELTAKNCECTLLNHVLYSGKFYAKGEEMSDGKEATAPTLRLYMPLHMLYGTEFKVVIDPPSYDAYTVLKAAFAEAGMNPTISDSHNGEAAPRIYLSLPARPEEGLYRLNNEHKNNFLCPGAL